MIIGVPKEIKVGESRVAVSPLGAKRLVHAGHRVLVQSGAGKASGWPDTEYRQVGAHLVRTGQAIYRRAQLICKVKEPQPSEFALLKPDQVLFTFLHLAGDRKLMRRLQRSRITAIAYETVETAQGDLPILEPMSDIAGRIATLVGANLLRYGAGGKGKLLSPVAGSEPGMVVVIGCGHVGRAALATAVGLGARVCAVDINPKKLVRLQKIYRDRIETYRANRATLTRLLPKTDLLIGAVLVAAHRAPHVVDRELVHHMQPGSVIVDVAIDQGGCIETSRATSIDQPTFARYGVVHCAIPNMPALVPRTASQLLSDQVFPYLKRLADLGWERACQKYPDLKGGLNLLNGKIVHPALASSKSNKALPR